MNDKYHKETKVAVQMIMPNDHLKQDQQNQRKQLKQSDYTNIIKEDHIDTYNDDGSKCKYNGCQVLLFQSTHQIRSNDIHLSHGSTYDDAYCDGCNNLDTSNLGKYIDVQVVKNNSSFSDCDDDLVMTATIPTASPSLSMITTATIIINTTGIPSIILFKQRI